MRLDRVSLLVHSAPWLAMASGTPTVRHTAPHTSVASNPVRSPSFIVRPLSSMLRRPLPRTVLWAHCRATAQHRLVAGDGADRNAVEGRASPEPEIHVGAVVHDPRRLRGIRRDRQ